MSEEKINYNSGDLKDHQAIGAVVKDDQGRVLMQDHVKYNFWTVPVGKCEEGESFHDGLIKEMNEELGINVIEYTALGRFQTKYEREGNNVVVDTTLYEIIKYEGEITNSEPEKHREFRYFTIDELKALPAEKLSHTTQFYLTTLDGGMEDE